MTDYILNIQLFAEAGAGVEVNKTTSEQLSAEMKTFYDKTLIANEVDNNCPQRVCNTYNP